MNLLRVLIKKNVSRQRNHISLSDFKKTVFSQLYYYILSKSNKTLPLPACLPTFPNNRLLTGPILEKSSLFKSLRQLENTMFGNSCFGTLQAFPCELLPVLFSIALLALQKLPVC